MAGARIVCYEMFQFQFRLLDSEAYGAEQSEKVLIKFSKESHVIIEGEGRANQCAVIDEEEGVSKFIVPPREHVFNDEC